MDTETFYCDYPDCDEMFVVSGPALDLLSEDGPDFCVKHIPVDPEDPIYGDEEEEN